ncbi:hypothetical protein J1L53_002868 [Salmonella enterica subsp. enterica serovar Shubra]|nr:hypothetical protein [Salmonella enterica subsp. enterica serovar Shubra]
MVVNAGDIFSTVFPAPAGINRKKLPIAKSYSRVPRASGDKPLSTTKFGFDAAVFPAPAGINRLFSLLNFSAKCVPRASGDKPRQLLELGHDLVCSPRQRG